MAERVAGKCSMRRECRAKSINLSSGRVSATGAHTERSRRCALLEACGASNARGGLVLLCTQVTCMRWRRTALRVGLLWGEPQTRKGRRTQHWRRVARVAQRARVRSGVPGAAGYALVTGVRARHRARWDLLGVVVSALRFAM